MQKHQTQKTLGATASAGTLATLLTLREDQKSEQNQTKIRPKIRTKSGKTKFCPKLRVLIKPLSTLNQALTIKA